MVHEYEKIYLALILGKPVSVDALDLPAVRSALYRKMRAEQGTAKALGLRPVRKSLRTESNDGGQTYVLTIHETKGPKFEILAGEKSDEQPESN